MAAARKCDRCGMCFDPTSENGEMARFPNPVFQTKESIRECRVTRRLLNDIGPDTMVDLCPGCTLEFQMFMKNESLIDMTDDLK